MNASLQVRWGEEGPTLALCGRGAWEYRRLISSSSTFQSLSNASENFQQDLKIYDRRGSLSVKRHEREMRFFESSFINPCFKNVDYVGLGREHVKKQLLVRIFLTGIFSTQKAAVSSFENQHSLKIG